MIARRALLALLAAAACLPAVPALAEEAAAPPADPAPLGTTLTFSGAPTREELVAQQRACEAKKPPRKAAGAISESTYKRMERIVDQIGKGQYAEAETKLVELAQGSRGDYEKAIIYQTLGFTYASQSKEDKAIGAFEQAIAANALPQQQHEQMMYNIAQLYVADGKGEKGMQALNAYLAESCNPVPDAHILLATVYAEKKQWRDSLKQVDLALVKSGSPKESWLQLKLALHYELKEYPRCAEVLVFLVGLAPMKADYWMQLNGMLYEIKKDQEALAVLSLAERRGFFDEEREWRNLSNMYVYMGIPLKAAQVLEKGLAAKQVEPTEKNLENLANAWLLAREYDKAEAAMAKAAAASDKGELYKRLGLVQLEQEKWKDALTSLQKAQQKGGLKTPGEVDLLIGAAATELKQWKTAEAALRQAMQHEKTAKEAAMRLEYLQQEIAYTSASGKNADGDKAPESKTN